MVKCPNCGEESESNFCPNCGEKLEAEITCPHCQSKIEAGSLFCSECGEKIETDEKEEDEKTPDKEDTIEKKETDEKTPDKEDTIEKKETDEKDKNEEKKSSDNNETSNKEDKNAKYCPHCSEKLDEDGAIFCSNCGKMVEVDEYSFNGIIQSIKFKRLIIVSLLGFVVTFVLGIILSFVAGARIPIHNISCIFNNRIIYWHWIFRIIFQGYTQFRPLRNHNRTFIWNISKYCS